MLCLYLEKVNILALLATLIIAAYNAYLYTIITKDMDVVDNHVSQSLSCWMQINPAFANSVDPDQLASSEANWSGSALFAIKYVNL